jgi:hypothetical protein
MKFLPILFALFVFSIVAKAQNEQALPFDDRGKFIYYEVVALKAVHKDSLQQRLSNYFRLKNGPLKLKSVVGDSAYIATGKLVISKTLLVMSHPSGEISYQFQAEVKEGKYRYWLTDFNFVPYQRDRYGNFVASTSIGTPLEETPGKLNAGQWKEYQAQAAEYAKAFAAKLKLHMASTSTTVAPVAKKEVMRKDW